METSEPLKSVSTKIPKSKLKVLKDVAFKKDTSLKALTAQILIDFANQNGCE